jgi:hypothetical protein
LGSLIVISMAPKIKGSEVLEFVLGDMVEPHDEDAEPEMDVADDAEEEEEGEVFATWEEEVAEFCPMFKYCRDDLPKLKALAEKLSKLTVDEIGKIEAEVLCGTGWEWDDVAVDAVVIILLTTTTDGIYHRSVYPKIYKCADQENLIEVDGLALFPTAVLVENSVLHLCFMEYCPPLLNYRDYDHAGSFHQSAELQGAAHAFEAGQLLRGYIGAMNADKNFFCVTSFEEAQFDLMERDFHNI